MHDIELKQSSKAEGFNQCSWSTRQRAENIARWWGPAWKSRAVI